MLKLYIEKRLASFTLRTELETDGANLALLGASGSGKSMTLKCIAGIERPDRGHIELDGRVLFDSERHIDLPPQQRRVGYLFQNYALFPNMTARQNILCGVRSGTRAEKRRRADAFIRRFRLEGLENRLPSQLSGGQQQRVALARILASEPQAILLDEPLSALDTFLRWRLELELTELLADFSGVILWVTHDLGECRRNCPRVCVMENGRSSPILATEQLLRCPQTPAQARLIGCRNFYKLENGYAPELGLHFAEKTAHAVAIPQSAVRMGTQLPCRVLRTVDDPTGPMVLLRPVGAPESAPPLCAQISAAPGAACCVDIDEETVFFFHA